MLDPWIGAVELRDLIIRRELRPREAAEFSLRRIERLNPGLGAFMTVTADRALEDADRLERLPDEIRRTMPLFGVPYSLKDLTWTRGIRTTLGSKNYENFIPPTDHEYASRIAAAGGILLGKTTTPELGGRPVTEGGLCPTARNPWNPQYTAGGSSGGAAVSLAAGMNSIAEGSDGGGSIRIPAACCGLVGIKPSRGRVSMAPAMGEAWAGFATNGPLARSVRDAALLLDVMAGSVVGDPYTAPPPPHRFVEAIKVQPRRLRLGAIAESALGLTDPEVRARFEAACNAFRELGHSVEAIALDPGQQLRDLAAGLVCAGLNSVPIANPELMDPEVRAPWERGRSITAAEYINLVTQMHNVARIIVQTLQPYDALLTPTLTRPAIKVGTGLRFDELWSWLAFTFPFNATGQPAVSVPNGFSGDGLPIGLQIVGRPYDECGIIGLAAQYEEARPWGDRRPPVD